MQHASVKLTAAVFVLLAALPFSGQAAQAEDSQQPSYPASQEPENPSTTPEPEPSTSPTAEPSPQPSEEATPQPDANTPSPSAPSETLEPTPEIAMPEQSPQHDGGTDEGDTTTVPLPSLGNWPIPEVTWELPELNLEQRVKLREKVALLRAKVNKAQQFYEIAQSSAQEARERARLSNWEALLAQVRAEQAHLVVERYAAGIYRSGSGDVSLVRIVNGSLNDPTVLLDEQALLSHASQKQQSELEQAQAVVREAQDLAQQAKLDLAQANELETASQEAAETLSKELAQAQKELQLLLSQPLPAQTIIGPDGCPVRVPTGTMRGAAAELDAAELCARSVRAAATPEAALAIKYAFRALGAPYACEGVGRELPFRYDCSSLVSRAYHEGAGLRTAGPGWVPSTRDMVPWDGVDLAPWAGFVKPEDARPGDLILYDTGGSSYRHVVMLLADGMMLHTNSCGDVAKVEAFWGYGTSGAAFLVARRVIPQLAGRVDL